MKGDGVMGAWTGNRLRRARLEQGISQGTLAKKLGVSQATISNWEQGKGKPSDREVGRLEKVLGKFNARAKKTKGNLTASDRSSTVTAGRAFGDWLRKTRQAVEMSAYELAEASGVSQVQIYNLENGRSRNPQTGTRSRLERALRARVPEDVRQEVAEEQQIVGLGRLTDFDPYDHADRPKCGGVYVFYDISDRPIYVGKSENIASRVYSHEKKFWFKSPIVSHAAYVEIGDEHLRHKVEQTLIKFLRSSAVLNVQSVDRD